MKRDFSCSTVLSFPRRTLHEQFCYACETSYVQCVIFFFEAVYVSAAEPTSESH
jgi:hypothetical protein